MERGESKGSHVMCKHKGTTRDGNAYRNKKGGEKAWREEMNKTKVASKMPL